MAYATIAVDIDKPLNIHSDVAAKVTFDTVVFVNLVAQPRDFILGQILCAGVGVYACCREDLTGRR